MNAEYTQIWPSEIGDIGVPIWGDKVIISPDATAFLTIRASPRRGSVQIASLPKTPTSGNSLRSLLIKATRIRLELTLKCMAGPLAPSIAEEIAIDIKTILEHYRSILDYLAHDIYSICNAPSRTENPRRLYFPNACRNETKNQFHKRLQKEFPQLQVRAPKLFEYMLNIQRFSGEEWLHNLVSLVNPMKHSRLAEWEEIFCRSLVVHHGGVGIRLGELGIHSVSIPSKQEIRFVSPMGIERAVRGPQELNVNTTKLFDADPEIEIDKLCWKTTAIKGTGRSIGGLLAEIDGGIRNTCIEITRAVNP